MFSRKHDITRLMRHLLLVNLVKVVPVRSNLACVECDLDAIMNKQFLITCLACVCVQINVVYDLGVNGHINIRGDGCHFCLTLIGLLRELRVLHCPDCDEELAFQVHHPIIVNFLVFLERFDSFPAGILYRFFFLDHLQSLVLKCFELGELSVDYLLETIVRLTILVDLTEDLGIMFQKRSNRLVEETLHLRRFQVRADRFEFLELIL